MGLTIFYEIFLIFNLNVSCIILSVPQNIIMDLNDVREGGGSFITCIWKSRAININFDIKPSLLDFMNAQHVNMTTDIVAFVTMLKITI